MSPAQFEKYVEAAKGSLRHLRVYPLRPRRTRQTSQDRLQTSRELSGVWRAIQRDPVDEPKQALKEATDDIIAWHVVQQQKWGQHHRDALSQKYGSAHAIYLEAAWRAKHSKWTVEERLAPVALEKWIGILNDAKPRSPFVDRTELSERHGLHSQDGMR